MSGNRFYKGRTNNHLTWVMVDSTDFATPESAVSAATKIKIYGKLQTATGVNFVSSGAGSLTNDIVHVGASALGIYTIALAKADLSDASAAFYDQYIVSLSATGCAYQVLVVEGVTSDSNLSAIVSDIYSAVIAPVGSAASDIASAVWAHAVGTRVDSRILVDKSTISDLYSLLSDLQSDFQSRVPKAVATNSQLSDLHSDLRSFLVVASGVQSDIYSLLSDFQSDFQSRVPKLVATNSQLSDLASDIKSAVGNITVTIGPSDVSDIASAVVAALPITSAVSDIYSMLSDFYSDFQSRVPKRVATDSQLSDLASDLKSAVTIVQSMASDAASAAIQANSRVLVVQSAASDTRSATQVLLSALVGHTGSTASAVVSASALEIDGIDHDGQFNGYWVKLLGGSQVDELRLIVSTDKTSSKVFVKPPFNSAVASGIDFVIVAGSPFLSNIHSDVQSRALVVQSMASDAASAAQQANSRVLLNQSRISDVYSMLSDFYSDFQSRVPKRVATDSQLSDVSSDLRSLLGAGVVLTASAMSDIASQVWAHTVGTRVDSRILVNKSTISDIYSLVSDLQSDFQSRVPKRVATDSQLSHLHSDLRSYVAGRSQLSDLSSDVKSAVVVVQSTASDIYSMLSDVQSDFQSRVPKRVATDSQLSDLHSDLRSFVAGRSQLSDLASDIKSAIAGITVSISASDVSDIASAVVAALPVTSAVSDIYSMLSDFFSDFQSRVPKLVATNSQLSDLASDIKSALGGIAVTVTASDMSDIASRVWAEAAATALSSRVLVNKSVISDIYSLVSDLQSDFQSRVPKRVATDSQLSDLASDIKSALAGIGVTITASDMSDIASRVWAEAPATALTSRMLVTKSTVSDIYSLLSDVQSDFQSRVPKRVATDSQLSDLHSDLKSHLAVSSGVQSDIYSLISDFQSDFGSRVPKLVATNSQLSDLASDVKSAVATRATASQVNAELLDVLTVDTFAEPTGVPAASATLEDKIGWLAALARNKVTQTATVQSLRNNADDADIASAAISDDGTTFTRDGWA